MAALGPGGPGPGHRDNNNINNANPNLNANANANNANEHHPPIGPGHASIHGVDRDAHNELQRYIQKALERSTAISSRHIMSEIDFKVAFLQSYAVEQPLGYKKYMTLHPDDMKIMPTVSETPKLLVKAVQAMQAIKIEVKVESKEESKSKVNVNVAKVTVAKEKLNSIEEKKKGVDDKSLKFDSLTISGPGLRALEAGPITPFASPAASPSVSPSISPRVSPQISPRASPNSKKSKKKRKKKKSKKARGYIITPRDIYLAWRSLHYFVDEKVPNLKGNQLQTEVVSVLFVLVVC